MLDGVDRASNPTRSSCNPVHTQCTQCTQTIALPLCQQQMRCRHTISKDQIIYPVICDDSDPKLLKALKDEQEWERDFFRRSVPHAVVSSPPYGHGGPELALEYAYSERDCFRWRAPVAAPEVRAAIVDMLVRCGVPLQNRRALVGLLATAQAAVCLPHACSLHRVARTAPCRGSCDTLADRIDSLGGGMAGSHAMQP
jgi:hypothetical protein